MYKKRINNKRKNNKPKNLRKEINNKNAKINYVYYIKNRFKQSV